MKRKQASAFHFSKQHLHIVCVLDRSEAKKERARTLPSIQGSSEHGLVGKRPGQRGQPARVWHSLARVPCRPFAVAAGMGTMSLTPSAVPEKDFRAFHGRKLEPLDMSSGDDDSFSPSPLFRVH